MTSIYHLALPQDWAAAQQSGDYRISSRGRTLEEEGFIHCSRADQRDGVRSRFYADVDELVMLTVDPDLLTSPWRFDPVGDDEFPHVYGPINLDAVTGTTVLRDGRTGSATSRSGATTD